MALTFNTVKDRVWGWGNESANALVERSIIVVLAALRLGLILQVVLACVVVTQPHGPLPLSAALGMGASLFSITLVLVMVWNQRLTGWWSAIDLGLGASFLIATSAIDPPAHFLGDWTHWAPGYALSPPVFLAACSKSPRLTLAMGALMGTIYVACTMPSLMEAQRSVLINGISYPLFAGSAAAFAAYSRRLAYMSDTNRDNAIAAATELELSNYRFHVHNASGLLARLGQPNLAPEELPALRRQAAAEANRLRHEFLLGRATSPIPKSTCMTLGEVVWNATDGFGCLPLEISMALGHRAVLESQPALALRAAIVSILHNIQFHAIAQSVLIHADLTNDIWELIVRDDGVGFDPDPRLFGFGLKEQVFSSLHANEMSVTLESKRGVGTCITITGISRVGSDPES